MKPPIPRKVKRIMNRLLIDGLNNLAQPTMKILALDPSSTRTGYAVFDGGRLIEHGAFTPRRTRDDANERIDAMICELRAVLAESSPQVVVIEDTSGKIAGRHKGKLAGLSIHGKAVGAFIWAAKEMGCRVEPVAENLWTRGTPKEKRQARIAYIHRDYDAAKDKGGDVADAIGLGEWWIACQRLPA